MNREMTREEAERHFGARAGKIKADILALPLPEKFRLVAAFLDAGADVAPALPVSLARLALADLEARLRT